MRKLLAFMLVFSLLAVSFLGFSEEEKVLNIFSWEGYIDSQTIENFTKETGIKINYTSFSSNEEMLAKMQSAPQQYDIILASDYVVSIMRKQDLLFKLDKEKLPNIKNIGESFLGHYFDEKNDYSIPYTAGTPLIIYNPDEVDFEISGYESLWDERLRDKLVIVDDARNIIGITLKTLGKSFNTTDENDLKQAEEKLAKLRPNVRSFNYNSPHFDILSGESSVGYMFTPFVVIAMTENPNLKIVYPKEGMGFGIDNLVISAKAPHPTNAHQFINYLLDAKVGAHIAEQQLYMTPNAAALAMMNETLKNNPAINIPKEILGETEFIMDLGEKESDFQAIWQRFKLLPVK